jgi:hypothetical protein
MTYWQLMVKFDVECSGATQTTVESQAEQLDRMPGMGLVYATQDRLIAVPDDRGVLAEVQDQTQTLPTEIAVALKYSEVTPEMIRIPETTVDQGRD